MANCESARQFVESKLNAAGVPIDQGMIEEAVKECCDDVASTACVNAVGKLVGTGVCVAYTQGACVPCCSAAMNLIAPVIKAGMDLFVGIAEEAWGWVADLFGGGSCSYQGAADELTRAYSDATRSLVAQVEKAWLDGRESIGLPRLETLPDGKFCNSKPWTDGKCHYSDIHNVWVIRRKHVAFKDALLDPILVEDIEKVMQETGQIPWPMRWEEVVLENAARIGLAIWPHFTWSIKGNTSAKVWMDMIDFGSLAALTPETYFAFRWSGFPCNQSKMWQDFANDLMAKRQRPLGLAVEGMAQSMAAALAYHQASEGMQRVTFRPSASAKSSTATTLLVVGSLATLGAMGYWFWSKGKPHGNAIHRAGNRPRGLHGRPGI